VGSLARLALAVAVGAVAALPARAAGEEDPEYQLKLPAGWTQTELVESDEKTDGEVPVRAMYVNDKTNQVLVIARISGPTDGVLGDDSDDETFYEAVETGVKKQYADYQRISSTKKKFGSGKKKVPALDLWFRVPRDGKKVVIGARFLFFRGYALSLVVDAPGSRKPNAATKKILESFQPAKAK
jgi:hypothetical protein